MRIQYAHHHLISAMLTTTNSARARKKAANLSVDRTLLEQARDLKLNLSQVFEASLSEAVRRQQREEWLRRNRAALQAYNAHIEKHGVFSAGLRSF